nr:four helix bundle protein [Geobacter sp. OR-1]
MTLVYRITESFPKSELYGITSQMRRAAVSIPSNIAEGAARFSAKEFLQFLNIAGGSLSELDTQVEIARQLAFIGSDDLVVVGNQIQTVPGCWPAWLPMLGENYHSEGAK